MACLGDFRREPVNGGRVSEYEERAAMGVAKWRRKEGGTDGKKGALGKVWIPRIKNSAGRREMSGFLWPNGRSFSRERVGSILWHAGVRGW
jgi:hypothetical protein